METDGRGTGKTGGWGRGPSKDRLDGGEGGREKGKQKKIRFCFESVPLGVLDGWIGSGISLLGFACSWRGREKEREDRKVFLMKYS